MTSGATDPAERRSSWRSRAALAVLGVAVFMLVLALGRRLGALVYLPISWDAWFDTDTVRAFEDISQTNSSLNRSAYHPFFALIAHAIYRALLFVLGPSLGWGLVDVTRVELALVSAALVVSFAALLRAMGRRWIEVGVFVALLATSASFVFFAAVPETFPLGALTIVVGLALAATVQPGWRGDVTLGAALALAVSATVTNVIPVGIAVLMRRSGRTLVRSSIVAALLVTAAAFAQAEMFPHAPSAPEQMMLLFHIWSERPDDVITGDLVPTHDLTHLGRVLRSFFVHSTVMPAPDKGPVVPILLTLVPSPMRILTAQTARVGSGTVWGVIATAGWLALLGWGTWATWTSIRGGRGRAVAMVAAALASQLVLHLWIGRETFLYSLHFVPLLVAFAATAVQGPARRIALALATAVALFAAVNNLILFDRSAGQLETWGRHADLTTPVPTSAGGTAFFEVPARTRLPNMPIELQFERGDGGDVVVHATQAQPGVWSLEVRTAGGVKAPLVVHAAEVRDAGYRAPEGSRAWTFSEKGEYSFLRYRWAIGTRSFASTQKPRNRPGLSCGPLDSPCVEVGLPRTNRWRVTVVDTLARPVWLGAGPVSDPRVWRILSRAGARPAASRDP